jgi:hypothetical protein
MKSEKANWQRMKEEPFGEGGQSKVYLVRTPERTLLRLQSLISMVGFGDHQWFRLAHRRVDEQPAID